MMSLARFVASILFAIATASTATSLEGQIGGLIKKKATEAVKGKDTKKASEEKKEEDPTKSKWEEEKCGPLTSDRLNDFERGLRTETTQRREFDQMFRSLRTQAQVVQCRNQELMTPAAQAILGRGASPNASNAQLQKAMEKNTKDLMEHLDKKCGQDPSQVKPGDAYRRAREEAAKAADLTPECYDKMKEITIAFCETFTPEQQNTAAEKGIRVPGKGNAFWVFTPVEATALKGKCADLLPIIKALDAGKPPER